jgi:molybdate transport system substrate-binding protein
VALGCATTPTATPVTVLAASSLSDAFSEVEAGFEADHPGVDVVISFAGTQTLATQLRHGLVADAIAAADGEHVAALAREGLVADDAPFATNRLVLALAPGVSAAGLERLPDLGRIVLGAPEAPVGRYTARLLDAAEGRYGEAWRAAVEAAVVSREPSVRLVVAKLALGEADAALVYATDLEGAPGVRAVALPEDLAPLAVYHQARVVGSPHPDLARAWLDHVAGPAGRASLARHGFGP